MRLESDVLKSPYPWFGGKGRVADLVWTRFGVVRNYVEPFFGSGAVLLQRPTPFNGPETINDLDGFVANFWRAIQADPITVAAAADNPVNENDLHARHAWLVERKETMQGRLEGDPEWFDSKAAGWWAWGLCCWIGSGWCSGDGPWRVVESNNERQLVCLRQPGIHRKLPHLGDAGRGVSRQLPHLGDAGQGVNRQLPHLGDAGQGVNRQLPHLGDAGQGLQGYFGMLADRLRNVRVCCGDWARVLGDSPTTKQGLTAVFLDPPYSAEANRDATLYARDDLSVANDVREWCKEHGDDPLLRIALCGYEGEHESLESNGWSMVAWKARGGYASQSESENVNARRERIWFSPNCLGDDRMPLFAGME